MDLSGKSVFLTGGAQGIGRAMMQALLEKGAKVMFCDIQQDRGKATEAELQKQYRSDDVIFRQCDVTDSKQLEAAFQAAVTKFGAVDICVNNAGIAHETLWENVIAVNMTAVIRGSLAPFAPIPVYAATKHAVVGFTTSWAKNPRMSEMGVKWRALCPGFVDTELLHTSDDQVTDPVLWKEIVQQHPFMKPPELAQAFISMLEDESSDDVIFEVVAGKGSYRKRQIVDPDGKSNLLTVD
ncbi:hypothetical protein BaRGS_00034635 [Batillaria attramentaria]|uniref:15-hydroxyprostaglandin dehydrogenase [NAD(+)] n=1 Tax=Batillaria attramentaria TaxID=370345 RepID=A0ABD0JHG4_9CAEN